MVWGTWEVNSAKGFLDFPNKFIPLAHPCPPPHPIHFSEILHTSTPKLRSFLACTDGAGESTVILAGDRKNRESLILCYDS